MHRDLRKDYRSDGYTDADFKAEVMSLVLVKTRSWQRPKSAQDAVEDSTSRSSTEDASLMDIDDEDM